MFKKFFKEIPDKDKIGEYGEDSLYVIVINMDTIKYFSFKESETRHDGNWYLNGEKLFDLTTMELHFMDGTKEKLALFEDDVEQLLGLSSMRIDARTLFSTKKEVSEHTYRPEFSSPVRVIIDKDDEVN